MAGGWLVHEPALRSPQSPGVVRDLPRSPSPCRPTQTQLTWWDGPSHRWPPSLNSGLEHSGRLPMKGQCLGLGPAPSRDTDPISILPGLWREGGLLLRLTAPPTTCVGVDRPLPPPGPSPHL